MINLTPACPAHIHAISWFGNVARHIITFLSPGHCNVMKPFNNFEVSQTQYRGLIMSGSHESHS